MLSSEKVESQNKEDWLHVMMKQNNPEWLTIKKYLFADDKIYISQMTKVKKVHCFYFCIVIAKCVLEKSTNENCNVHFVRKKNNTKESNQIKIKIISK